jgi:hypothetical protein
MAAERLTWNTPALTAESFDDEVVIVNFDSGKYHSLQGTGRQLWQWLGSAPSVDALVALASQSFRAGAGDDVAGAVHTFVETLRAEGLLVEAPADAPAGTFEPVDGGVFTVPVLNTFSDMQELLLLDPIHEVDDAGWPVARPSGGN